MNDKMMPICAADRLELEEHLNRAASLSRVLWHALRDADGVFRDPSDEAAFRRVAENLDDHLVRAVSIFDRPRGGTGDV